MKIFVTGVGGQLGFDVMNELERRSHQAIASDIQENSCFKNYIKLDLTDHSAVERVLIQIKPDAVVHCAAWTAVDAAEDEANRQKVYNINVKATENIAKVCRKISAKMLYISTDYVFDGKGDTPFEADCKDFGPLSVYGKSKLEGESSVSSILEKYFIVRIAWAFGLNGNNFVKTMLNVGKRYDTVRVVCDQIGTPTYTFDLARLIVDMCESEKYGCYHATNSGGYISWYDFACEIFKKSGYSTSVVPVSTKEYGLSKAERPFNSRLDKSKLTANGFEPLPDWKDALKRYLNDLEINNGTN